MICTYCKQDKLTIISKSLFRPDAEVCRDCAEGVLDWPTQTWDMVTRVQKRRASKGDETQT